MAENTFPLVKFFFQVKLGNDEGSFLEVSGLETEVETIEYRAGNSPDFSPIKRPGLARVGTVTLKKGVFPNDQALWDWFSKVGTPEFERRTVTISLMDEENKPKITWTLDNAFPTKIMGADLNSESNEVAVETMEIAHDTLTFEAK